jgi:cob(I)alamin adenosyltransferase
VNLEPLKTFVLPAGSPAAVSLHVARTVCRRAERRVIAARREAPIRDEVVRYLNRLSDLLFVLAREANRHAGLGDAPWVPKA